MNETTPPGGQHVPARPLRQFLLLDIVRDRDSRPALAWAGLTLLLGMVVYSILEGWSLLDSLYFSVISLATVGYGDLTPTTPLSKAFTIVYVLNGIAILLALFDRIRVVRSRDMSRRRGR
ncbi:MAG: potassium channel family protein [Actinomycetota bacterium]